MHDEQTTPPQAVSPQTSRRSTIGRLAGIGGAGVIAGLMALGATSLAQAQDPVPEPAPMTQPSIEADEVDIDEVEFELTEAEEDAVWDAFDTCLEDQGLDLDALEAADEADELTEADEDAIDAALDVCDPILVEAFGEEIFDEEFGCDDDEEDDDTDEADEEDDDADETDEDEQGNDDPADPDDA